MDSTPNRSKTELLMSAMLEREEGSYAAKINKFSKFS
jgi:hypothetical protein